MPGVLDQLSRVGSHLLISGTTGSGKSHLALAIGRKFPGPVVFYNPQDDDLAGDWTHADRSNDVRDLFRAKRGRISYVPNSNREFGKKEIKAIVDHVMLPLTVHRTPILFIFDESDTIAPQGGKGQSAVHEVLQRGRKLNVWGICVTQFPSLIDKILVRQCLVQAYFFSPYAKAYYKAQFLPGDYIEGSLENAPEHSFMLMNRGKLEGPMKI